MFAKLSVCVVLRPGNHGRRFTDDFRRRRKSTIGTLRETIWTMTHVTSKTASYLFARQGALTCKISRLFHVNRQNVNTYSVPEQCVKWVKKLHGDFEVVLKI